jgi:hypothetical protein
MISNFRKNLGTKKILAIIEISNTNSIVDLLKES